MQLLARDLSEAQIQSLRDKFIALNKGGDGLLSVEDLLNGARHVGSKLSEKKVRNIVDTLGCAGGIGKERRIGYKDFIAALADRAVKFEREQLWGCFQKFDVRQCGRISLEDVQQSLMSPPGDGSPRMTPLPALTESEWEDIVMPCGNGGVSERLELDFNGFVALMAFPGQ